MADLSIKKPYFLITWYKYNNQLYLQQTPLLNHSFPSSPIWYHTIYSYVSEKLLLRSCYHAKQGSGLQNHFSIRTLFLLHTGLYIKREKKITDTASWKTKTVCMYMCPQKYSHVYRLKLSVSIHVASWQYHKRTYKNYYPAEEVQIWIDQFF